MVNVSLGRRFPLPELHTVMAENEARPVVKRPPGLDTVLETDNGTKVEYV